MSYQLSKHQRQPFCLLTEQLFAVMWNVDDNENTNPIFGSIQHNSTTVETHTHLTASSHGNLGKLVPECQTVLHFTTAREEVIISSTSCELNQITMKHVQSICIKL